MLIKRTKDCTDKDRQVCTVRTVDAPSNKVIEIDWRWANKMTMKNINKFSFD